jgi:hypothetical protein
MSNLSLSFLAAAVVSLIVGLVGQSNEVVNGLGKAMAGVFMILFFITRFFGEKEA